MSSSIIIYRQVAIFWFFKLDHLLLTHFRGCVAFGGSLATFAPLMMRKLFGGYANMRVKSWLAASLIVMCLGLFGWIPPAIADIDNSQDRLFEEQVLEVIRAHPEVVLESLKTYQRQQAQEQQVQQANVAKELLAHPADLVGDSPAQGFSDQILLVEFSDFQCPYCAREQQVLKQFVDNHPNEVTFVYKHLPLTQIHNEAMSAAKAAWAANQQGKFWPYHDELFNNRNNLGEDLYLSIANQLDLDLERFNRDRAGEAASNAIQQDIELAKKLGVRGTPFFLMNEETFSGAVPLNEIERKFSKLKGNSIN
jgi:protein-disulfide isomerase